MILANETGSQPSRNQRGIFSNFHTHTTRCKHATGADHEYVEAAIEAGIKRLGFSDHIPVPYEDYVSRIRMGMSEAEEYRSSIDRLAQEYKQDIQIFCGFEMEYFPKYYEKQMKMIRDLGIEYLLLGQHHILNEVDGYYVGRPDENEAKLHDYVSFVIEGIETGNYLYLAHPDLVYFTGDRGLYTEEITRLCEAMKRLNTPLEINGLGLLEGRHYPGDEFFKIAKTVGNDIVVGIDAHSPKQITDPDGVGNIFKVVDRFGFTIVNEQLLR